MALFLQLTIIFSSGALAGNKNASCEAGSAQSCEKSGQRFFNQKLWVEAEKYFDKGCDLKSLNACRMKAHSWGHQGNHFLFEYNLGLACDLKSEKACDDLKRIDELWASFADDKKEFEEKSIAMAEKQKDEEERSAALANRAEQKKLALEATQLEKNLSVCRKHNARACSLTARYYFEKNELALALEQYEKACDLKDYVACHSGGLVSSLRGGNERAKSLLSEACQNKIRAACRDLDGLHQEEREGENKLQALRALESQQQQAQIANEQRHQSQMMRAQQAAADENRRQRAMQDSMQSMQNFLSPPSSEERQPTNCETQPVTDIYSGKITSYRTVCR